ncbi:MAG: hypothetical protein ACYC6T_04315 [Thermoleophilia bacterium]
MASQAVFSRPGHFGSAEWELEGRFLHITAQGLPPETYSLRELTSVAGDDHTIHLGYQGSIMTLSRLGTAGAGLCEQLLSEWPRVRAEALQIAGTGESRRYAGTYTPLGGSPSPFAGLLYDDVLILAPEGADVRPLYLSSLAQITSDETTNTVSFRTWSGDGGTFSRLGPEADEFAATLDDSRSRIRDEAIAVVANGLPALPASVRNVLATRWPAGEMLALAALEAGSPDLESALRTGWIGGTPRAAHAQILLEQSDAARVYVGHERRPNAAESPLWLLTGTADTWLLENLHEEDCSTYRFRAGTEVPALTSLLLKSGRFSREALYAPLEELARAHNALSIPARDLPFLRDLRERFVERIAHDDPNSWRERVTERV